VISLTVGGLHVVFSASIASGPLLPRFASHGTDRSDNNLSLLGQFDHWHRPSFT